MDPETIQKIATEVAKHLPPPPYAWWVPLVVPGLLALLGAVLGEYLKTRAQNLAIKADLRSIQAQLRGNTEIAETIKANVSQRDWAQREWANLRRTKLEKLLENIHKCNGIMIETINHATEGVVYQDSAPSPWHEASTIVILYLPELQKEFDAFDEACRDLWGKARTLATEKRDATSDPTAGERAQEAFEEQILALTTNFTDTQQELISASRPVLMKIVGMAS
jgi:hypothetical protein